MLTDNYSTIYIGFTSGILLENWGKMCRNTPCSLTIGHYIQDTELSEKTILTTDLQSKTLIQ